MEAEWDEAKRCANLARHGVDFVTAALIFEGPVLEAPDRRRAWGEPRWRALGERHGVSYLVAFTWRGQTRRIISAWRVGDAAKARYQKVLTRAAEGHGGPGREPHAP